MIDRTGNDSVDRGGVVRPGRDVEYFPGGFLRLKNNVADCTGDIIDRDNIEDRAASDGMTGRSPRQTNRNGVYRTLNRFSLPVLESPTTILGRNMTTGISG